MPVTFSKTEIEDVLMVESRLFGDARGFLTETYSKRDWEQNGHTETFVQDNLSLSDRGTMRGMHYQIAPHAMGKLVRAITGSIFDVAVDLRHGSPTFGKWVGKTLAGGTGLAMWVPEGFAHGFLALEDDTRVYYKCTAHYAPDTERCLSYKDPDVNIEWPFEPTSVVDRDAKAPTLRQTEPHFTYRL